MDAARQSEFTHQLPKISLAESPKVSQLLKSPLLDIATHRAFVNKSIAEAARLDLVIASGPSPFLQPVAGVFTLAEYQSPFKAQNDRGTCWAFAGAAALEAAYRRRFGITIDVSEEYIFHMGKAFALNRAADNSVVTPVENNSSLTGFQGSGDICKKLSENAIPPEHGAAPYLPSQQSLLDILPVLGFANQQALQSQEDYDAIEFCEQHIPLIARVNARYRATGWKSLGGSPSTTALENTLLAEHEVVCDVTTPGGGHVLMLIGFDRNRKVFFAKNHWGENKFIEIAYSGDPTFKSIDSGWYIEDVVDPTFVQNEACWLGNWQVQAGGNTFRLLLRRSEDFAAPGTPTRLGSAYLADGRHDVNGQFLDNGSRIRLFIAPTTAPTMPGTLSGTEIDAQLNFADIYNASGTVGRQPVAMSRFVTRFAALFEKSDGTPWQARHGIDAATYQATFDSLVSQGYRLTNVCGYSEGTGARFNGIWEKKSGPAWEARHGLTSDQYQATFDTMLQRGFRLVTVSGYAENGQARYAALWEQRQSPAWQAHHGLSRDQYQQTFDELAAQGYAPVQVCGYRVNVDVLFAAIWEKQSGIAWVARYGLTSSAYQKAFDEQVSAGRRLACVSGYSDTGIARYAAIWRQEPYGPWQARHGLDSAGYQRTFDELNRQGYKPVQVCGYGDGFYPA